MIDPNYPALCPVVPAAKITILQGTPADRTTISHFSFHMSGPGLVFLRQAHPNHLPGLVHVIAVCW